MCKKFFLLMLQIGLGAVFVIGVRGKPQPCDVHRYFFNCVYIHVRVYYGR